MKHKEFHQRTRISDIRIKWKSRSEKRNLTSKVSNSVDGFSSRLDAAEQSV